jgi:hypothetical protein
MDVLWRDFSGLKAWTSCATVVGLGDFDRGEDTAKINYCGQAWSLALFVNFDGIFLTLPGKTPKDGQQWSMGTLGGLMQLLGLFKYFDVPAPLSDPMRDVVPSMNGVLLKIQNTTPLNSFHSHLKVQHEPSFCFS